MHDCVRENGSGRGFRSLVPFLFVLIVCVSLSCSRTYEREPPEFEPVSVIVPDMVSTIASTRIVFTECILPDGLAVTLTRQSDGKEALIITITGPVSLEGCIQEATFTPAYSLQNEAFYSLSIQSPAVTYSATVEATSTFQYRPGIYLLVNTDYDILDQFSENLRTWFVEFGEPDDNGVFDMWFVDADAPSEGGVPICFGWSAQPVSEGQGIGWNAFTQGVLSEKKDTFSSPPGATLDIDVVPLACIIGGSYHEQFVPAGETLSGRMAVDNVEIPCGVPQDVDQVFYTGRRCPDGTVLPHE